MIPQNNLEKLSQMRQEWEEAAGDDLVQAKGSVGLILADVTRALDLDPDQQLDVLGANLYVELNGNK